MALVRIRWAVGILGMLSLGCPIAKAWAKNNKYDARNIFLLLKNRDNIFVLVMEVFFGEIWPFCIIFINFFAKVAYNDRHNEPETRQIEPKQKLVFQIFY